MSMTGSGSKETSPNLSKKPKREVCPTHGPQSLLQPCYGNLNRCVSPLLGLFGRKEYLPYLLEHEKALLVIKEHNYAKMPERPEVLQLSNIHSTHLSCLDGDVAVSMKDTEALLNARTDLLSLRDSLNRERNEPSVIGHLRQVVGLQVSLIREQQEQLHGKDKDLGAVRKEKEQLEARLERMERRLAILQKHSRLKQNDVTTTDSLQSPVTMCSPLNATPTTIRSHYTRRESLVIAEKSISRSRSVSVEPGSRNRSHPASRTTTPSPLDTERDISNYTVKRSHKRKIKDVDKEGQTRTPKKRTKHQRELRTTFEYEGLQLNSNSEFPVTHNDSDVLSSSFRDGCANMVKTPPSKGSVSVGDVDPDIVIPSWRLFSVVGLLPESPSDIEDLTDEVFYKRHRKSEEDEKRRKRWDIQRARALREHQELLRKYNMKGGSYEKTQEQKKDSDKPLTSFIPDLCEIDTIEVMDTIAISGFGRSLPVMKASVFELPWFDLDMREVKETVRKTRSRTKANRTSIGGSADEL